MLLMKDKRFLYELRAYLIYVKMAERKISDTSRKGYSRPMGEKTNSLIFVKILIPY